MAMFIILTLAKCPLKQWGIYCPTHREVQDGGNHFDEGGSFGGGSTDQLRDHTFTSSLTDRQTHYKVITVESSLFVGVYVRGFCGFFLHTNQEITSQRTSKVLTIHEHWLNRYDSTVLYLHKDWWHKNYISSLNNNAYIQTDWELNKENPETHLWL